MAVLERLKEKIVEAVSHFERDQMSIIPESISINFHPRSLMVSLMGNLSPAEKSYARDARGSRLLEKFYRELFNAAKPVLEKEVAGILGRSAQRCSLSIDPESGGMVILFSFSDDLPPREIQGESGPVQLKGKES